ncbi:MAG: TonB-dependent receptor, partial [Muribaculaceae bacterium]|nr:TonB-dependent receptor [Muribaculaceae bacterium]
MIKLKHICVVLLCLMIGMSAVAQVKITGKVVDDAGQPIEFATVRILGTAIGVNTNEKGIYEVSVAKADTIMVEFSCMGYSTVTRQLIKPEGTIQLNPKLYEKTHELTEVTVTEYKKQTNAMQGIDVSQTSITPSASGNVVENVLTTMAGVSSKNEMSSQYMVRGGSYDENSVYINGIEVYRPQLISSGQQEGLSIINGDMVQKVEFSTGGFNAEYGDKMSSVLDITYRDPEAFEGALSASLQGGSLMLGYGGEKFSMMHGARYKRNSSLLGSLESKGEYDPQYFDYQTYMVLKPSNKFRVSFLGNIALNNYRFVTANRETSFGTSTYAKSFKVYFDGQERDKFYTYFGALSFNYRPNKGND